MTDRGSSATQSHGACDPHTRLLTRTLAPCHCSRQYGKSKLDGERAILAEHDACAVLRVPVLFGTHDGPRLAAAPG